MTGNYSGCARIRPTFVIIPYQVMTGNYSTLRPLYSSTRIIPYQVMTGNYSVGTLLIFSHKNHTIPSDDRELQRRNSYGQREVYHTIPSDDRELQQMERAYPFGRIIPYQVMTGNYSYQVTFNGNIAIIPYQVMTGNYSYCDVTDGMVSNHTIPSDDRELQLGICRCRGLSRSYHTK